MVECPTGKGRRSPTLTEGEGKGEFDIKIEEGEGKTKTITTLKRGFSYLTRGRRTGTRAMDARTNRQQRGGGMIHGQTRDERLLNQRNRG